jgi:hypothetical protein
MAEIVDPKTGKIKNVSQRVANASTESYTSELKEKVSNTSDAISTAGVKSTATTAINALNDAKTGVSGQIAGQVTGGIESLTQQADAFKGELNQAKDTVTGLLNGDASSLENMATDMVEGAVSGLLGKLGTIVEIEFSFDPDTGVTLPVTSTLSPEGGADALAGILSLITGLGISTDPKSMIGDLQKVVTDASPAGLLSAGKDMVSGKIGAFTSTSINSLASDAIKSVTKEVNAQITAGLGAFGNVNKVVSYQTMLDDGLGKIPGFGDGVSGIESDGSITYSTATTSNPGTGGVLGRTDSDELFGAITNVDSDALTDLSGIVTRSKEIRQNLTGAVDDLTNLSGGKEGDKVLNSVQTESTARGDYQRNVEEYKGLVKTRAANGSESGIVQGLSTKVLTQIEDQIRGICPTLEDAKVQQVIALSQGDASDESQAIKILSDCSGLSYEELQRFIRSIDTTITNATRLPPDAQVFSDPYEIGSYSKSWNKGQGNPIFPYVSSVEELSAEFRAITRELDPEVTAVVHWTETHTNKNIGSEEINGWHLAAGLDGLGYHYVCRRDGSLQRGRPVNEDGQHTPGYDKGTLSFVFVGGINAPTGTPNAANFLSSQSLTRSQVNTFDHFCRAFFASYPGGIIKGHSELDETGQNVDPGFEVTDYVLTRFGKHYD